MKAAEKQMQLSMMKSAKQETSKMLLLALFSCAVVLMYLPVGDNGISFHENLILFAAQASLIWLTWQPVRSWFQINSGIRKLVRELKELKDNG